jgi:hypothetical protein
LVRLRRSIEHFLHRSRRPVDCADPRLLSDA